MSLVDDELPGILIAHNTLKKAIEPGLSLTGGTAVSSPANPTPYLSNDPGLESNSLSGTQPKGMNMQKHWLWIALAIVALLAGLWYFGVFGSSTAATA